MSASLVGSEMCIRDSRYGPGGSARHPTPGLRAAARTLRAAPPVRPCLVYTSDGADDMQCVDLGGR
eukprot:1889483-Alexandrium_andersonii.AAC.1